MLLGTTAVFGQNPVANFNANVVSGCAPLSVNFTDQSTGGVTAWNWEFSNGTLSNVQNPSVTFSTPGTYSVKLVVQNATGIAELERIAYITVFPSPVASFNANTTLGCVPSTINFNDLSTPAGQIASWEWDFGDGGTSNQQNPSHTFTQVGFYTIVLKVTSNTGCTNTSVAGNYIRIVGGVTTDFSFTPPTDCLPPYNVPFQNQSSGPGNIAYTWDFGNGQNSTAVSPTATYAAPGTYTVSLNALSDLGCTGSVQKTITINSTTTDFNAPTSICLNQPVNFQNTSTSPPVTSTWSFGDGTSSGQINPIKTFITPGSYPVKVINTYASCIDSITKVVTVTDKPTVNFTAVDTADCKAPFTVQFTDLTAGAASWLWEFGDGTTSTLQNPTHTYTTTGTFNVSLTVTTAAGCSNKLTKTPYIIIRPTAILLALPVGGCAPYLYTPVAVITTVDPVATYAWDFGNGQTSTAQNPTPVNYPTPGTYAVSLTITTQSGCTVFNRIDVGVQVGVPSVANFNAPTDVCASDTVSFIDASVITPLTPPQFIRWQWDFGDGGISDIQNPQHQFLDTGIRFVRLTVFNNECPSTIVKAIHVRPPIAKFSYFVDCANNNLVTFQNTSIVDPALAPLTYEWDFGNGLPHSFLQTPAPVNYTPGTYTVTLTVTNGACRPYVYVATIVIASEPATFSINRRPVCKNEVFTLTATGSNPANVLAYYWRVGGVLLADTTRTVTHSIATVGTYDVQLSVRDINGCITINTQTNYLQVNGPTAGFAPSAPGACYNKPFAFNDLSTPAGSIASWKFDFGDGNTQTFTAAPFTHNYTIVGRYIVSLKVTDNAGCTDSIASPVDLLVTNPIAGFRADTFYCPQAPLQFVDTSSGAGLTYAWTFGDGGTAAISNPQHAYPAGDADYTVKLKITDISGCSDSVTKQNYIKIRKPKAKFEISDTTTICPPLRTGFVFQGTDFDTFYWDFGDGSPPSTRKDPFYFYNTYGTFTPKLYLLGKGGCIDSAQSSVTVHNPGNAQVNYGPITTACNSLNVDFNLVVPPGFKFQLSFGDGTIDSSGRTILSHFYSRPSLNQPVMIIYDQPQGCQAAVVGNPRIDVLGAIPLFGKDKKEFCDAGVVTFKDFTTKNEPIISTVWDFGDGGTSNATDPTHNFATPGQYIVKLTVTTQSNCSNTYQDTVFVYRTPAPSIVSRDTICINTSETISGILAQPDTLTHWQWTFGNGQTSTQQSNNVTYTTPGDFNISLTTTNKINCSANAVKTIHVTQPPGAAPVLDPLTIISGGNAPLAMNYTGNIVSYNWVPATKLSCTDCPVPIASPQFTTKYTVQVTDQFGCRNSGDITVIVVCNNQNFFVPNTFSPNGDGQNDAFFPRGKGLFTIKSFTIFNRWGQIVFEKRNLAVNDPAAGWNGTFNGQKASPDVYVYMMEILCDNGTVIPVKGNVTLLR